MSDRYEELLAEWRAASAATRDAQGRLRQKWDAFIEGHAPEPSQEEVAGVHRLREVENRKLDAAMQSMRESGRARRN